MPTTQLKLETVTPMFLRGADNRTPELRPPAFKALFRYWWRAAQVNTKSGDLRDQEGKRFGNTKRKSPLLIHISGVEELNQKDCQPLPHHQGGWNCSNCPSGEKCKKGYKNKAYDPGQKFKIRLTAPNLNDYKKIAELSFLLGGVGNRSRRGFGSICYTDWNFQSVDELEQKVYQTLDGISPGQFKHNTGKIQTSGSISLPDYPVIRSIYFGVNTSNKVGNLLRKIGQKTHDHSDDALGYVNMRRKQRLASPIHVRIQKVGSKYIPIVTHLHSIYTFWGFVQTKQKDFIHDILT